MKNTFEHKKYTSEEVKFFNNLAEEYNLEQTEEHLIVKKESKEIYIPKWHKIPINGELVKIEDHIKKMLSKDQDET